MSLYWTADLEIGIPVIDAQHQRIVEYINRVERAHRNHTKEDIATVLDELVDYTLSHFAFEESLMEEAGYPFAKAHKKVHQLFARRIDNFQQQAKAGEDITEELLHVLKAWLVNHIKRDDNDYSDVVRVNLEGAAKRVRSRKEGWLSRLFG